MPNRPVAAVLCTAVAVLVGACSPSAPPTTPETAEPSAGPTTRTPVRTPRPPGPLWSYLEQVNADSDANRAERHRQSEDLIAACMADEGFEYWPREELEWDPWEQYTLEYAQQYGYGGTSNVPAPTLNESDRKNQEYLESLSAAARKAYETAYMDVSDPEAPTGCAQDAQVTAYEDSNWEADPAFADLNAEFRAWIFEMLEDPRMTEAATEWSACMAEAGYDVATPDDAQEGLSTPMPDGTLSREITPDSDEQEIATAVADLTCQLETDYQTSMLAAQHAMEQEFVDAHRDQLEALVDAHAFEQD